MRANGCKYINSELTCTINYNKFRPTKQNFHRLTKFNFSVGRILLQSDLMLNGSILLCTSSQTSQVDRGKDQEIFFLDQPINQNESTNLTKVLYVNRISVGKQTKVSLWRHAADKLVAKRTNQRVNIKINSNTKFFTSYSLG